VFASPVDQELLSLPDCCGVRVAQSPVLYVVLCLSRKSKASHTMAREKGEKNKLVLYFMFILLFGYC
jgi:hypothetical protein